MLWRTFYVTLLLVVAMLGIMQWELEVSGSVPMGRACAMSVLVLAQGWYALSCRYVNATALTPRVFVGNPWLLAAIFVNAGAWRQRSEVPLFLYEATCAVKQAPQQAVELAWRLAGRSHALSHDSLLQHSTSLCFRFIRASSSAFLIRISLVLVPRPWHLHLQPSSASWCTRPA